MSYRAVINDWVAIQSDVQWMRNHGEAPVKNALAVGVRFDVSF